jgi:hypothetical protein
MQSKQNTLEKQLEAERKKSELLKLKLHKLHMLEEEKKYRDSLPHLYLHKRYQFQSEFEQEKDKRIQILCAANQLGKSSSVIQRVIDLATSKDKWKDYWPETVNKGLNPAQWWYLYPSMDVAGIEFEEKWKPLLPKNQDDPVYGWKKTNARGGSGLKALEFKSGINVYFKSYEQSAQNLQSGSCYLIVCDEELPVHLLPELQMRVNATRGYMWFAFTATIGQPFWEEVVEKRIKWKNEAKIWQVSLYDCQKYADGTPSKWTDERIQETIDRCTSEQEVQRRVLGKFVKDDGLVFATFSRTNHLIPYYRVPDDWIVVAGVDYGSGGNSGHASSIVFVAVNPKRTEARVIRAWRGDGIVTTCRDVIVKLQEMSESVHRLDYIYYDWAAKDLATFASQAGIAINKADKDRKSGIDLLSTLFKTNRLLIMHTGSDAQHAENIPDDQLAGFKLAEELSSLAVTTRKAAAKDDLIDSLRYAVLGAGMDWNMINQYGSNISGEGSLLVGKSQVLTIDEMRAQADKLEKNPNGFGVSEELDFWNSHLESIY